MTINRTNNSINIPGYNTTPPTSGGASSVGSFRGRYPGITDCFIPGMPQIPPSKTPIRMPTIEPFPRQGSTRPSPGRPSPSMPPLFELPGIKPYPAEPSPTKPSLIGAILGLITRAISKDTR